MPSGDGDRRALPVQAVAATAAAAFAAVSGVLLARKGAALRVPMRNGVAPGDWDSFEQQEAVKQARAALASRAPVARRRASCVPRASPAAPGNPAARSCCPVLMLRVPRV